MRHLATGAMAMLIAGAVVLSAAIAGAPLLTGAAQTGASGDSSCLSAMTRTILPNAIRSCESSRVALQLRPSCPGRPLDVVLALGTNAHEEAARLRRPWTRAAVDALGLATHPNVRAGIVTIEGRHGGSVVLDLTNDEGAVRRGSAIRYGSPEPVPEDICINCGFAKAARLLDAAGRDSRKAIVFIGVWYVLGPPRDARRLATGSPDCEGRGRPVRRGVP